MPCGGKNKLRFFIPIFFLSGLAGLAYQVLWAKTFAAAIGHEYPAMLAVVSAFMCGMAIGNMLLARTKKIPPACYGWLEVLIGGWAVLVTLLTPLIESFVIQLLGVSPSSIQHWTIVFVIMLLTLLPATAAMGATLPAAERFLAATGAHSTVALLYGTNTAGAMVGALAAAFWIMPSFGLRNGGFVLAAINIVCGIAALLLARTVSAPSPGNRSSASGSYAGLNLQLFFTGLIGIGFEVAIVRGLTQILENTVYTFAVVLAVFLFGNALGAALYYRTPLNGPFQRPVNLFAALSISSLAAAIALRWTPSIYPSLRLAFGDSLFAVAAAETLVAAMLLLLPCICMGAVWSRLAQSSLDFRENIASAVAINLLGAALAPILWGLVIIPIAGLKGALAIVPIAYAAFAGRRRTARVALALSVCAVPLVTSNRQLIDTAGNRIVSFREGVIGSVAVLEGRNGSRVLKFNNRFQMGGTAARIAEQRQTDIPLLLHPNPQRALFIGLGTGISFAAAAYHPNLIADGVELVPGIVEAMPLFNDASLQSTNLHVHVADGRRFVRATTNLYDVIISDLFHPAQDGAGFLYTREHFQAIRNRLTGSGLFCQWLPLYQMDLSTIDLITRTFETVFPNSQRYLLRFNIDTPVIGLIGWQSGGWRSELFETRMRAHPQLHEHLRSVGLTDSLRLFGCYLDQSLSRPTGELNTDANPAVIFRAPAVTFQRKDNPGERLVTLLERAESATFRFPWDGGTFHTHDLREAALSEELPKFIRARNVYLKALLDESRGKRDAALAAFIESARISPHFTAGYAQALAFATALAESNPDSARKILRALIEAQPDRPVAGELLERLEKRK